MSIKSLRFLEGFGLSYFRKFFDFNFLKFFFLGFRVVVKNLNDFCDMVEIRYGFVFVIGVM